MRDLCRYNFAPEADPNSRFFEREEEFSRELRKRAIPIELAQSKLDEA